MAQVPRISVVDDDECVRESLQSLLRSMGFAAEVFASAEAFLRWNERHETDCLILDVHLPGMSGPELQRRLSADGVPRKVPVVFITAHGEQNQRAQLLAGGAVACLPKPFDEDALLQAVHAAIRRP